MKNIKSDIIGTLLMIVLLVFGDYYFLLPWNIKSKVTWVYVIVCLFIVMVLKYFLDKFMDKNTAGVILIPIGATIVFFIIMLASSRIFNASDYSNILKVNEEADFSKDIVESVGTESIDKYKGLLNTENIITPEKESMEPIAESAIVKKSINPHLEEIGEYLNDIIERIVEELVSKTLLMKYKDGKFEQTKCISKDVELVSLEEIHALPESLRPQLTGRHVKKDADNHSSHMILRRQCSSTGMTIA